MLENAFRGGKRYWILLGVWVLLILLGLVFYAQQLREGLTITGMEKVEKS